MMIGTEVQMVEPGLNVKKQHVGNEDDGVAGHPRCKEL